MEQTLEYCSLFYLNQWFKHDKNYCRILKQAPNDEKLSALEDAAKFYRVARNLPTQFDIGKGLKRYQPVLDILEKISDRFQGKDEHERVDEILAIAQEISTEYGGRGVLSLTTKFLWLKIKKPIIIYDSQAKAALNFTGNDLQGYYKKWRSEFELYENKIKKVCTKLENFSLYTIDQGNRKQEDLTTEIQEISQKPWFHERVFDIYLWSKGK